MMDLIQIDRQIEALRKDVAKLERRRSILSTKILETEPNEKSGKKLIDEWIDEIDHIQSDIEELELQIEVLEDKAARATERSLSIW
jgi:septal ring factor EnvC (AmiA/AmiB activator)